MDLVKHTTRIVDKNLKVKIEIRLKVQKETGIRYFDITATSRMKGSFIDRKMFPSDFKEIPYSLELVADKFPELKPIIDLHLSDTLGQPPYFLDRGLEIFMAKGSEKARLFFRITKKEYYVLISSPCQKTFVERIAYLNISLRWKKQAAKAMKIMEKLCFPICSIDFNDQNPYVGESSESFIEGIVSDIR